MSALRGEELVGKFAIGGREINDGGRRRKGVRKEQGGQVIQQSGGNQSLNRMINPGGRQEITKVSQNRTISKDSILVKIKSHV